MINPTVLYILLTGMSAQVILQKQYLRKKDNDPTKLQYSAEFNQELQRFQDQVTNTYTGEVQLMKTPSSDDFLKLLHELLVQEYNGKLKPFNNHLINDTVSKHLQDFLVSDKNQAEIKNKVPEEILVAGQRIARSNNTRNRHQKCNEDIYQSIQDSHLNVTMQVGRHGYRAQEYTVLTEDGYVLTLHRISTENTPRARKRLPVLLMHGLLLNSACWLGTGPSNGLAYLLAKAGYDVWLGNARGNYYSHAHVSLDLGFSSYWQFCPDEIGRYDLPAIFDKVLKETGAEKLDYVGFSQGGGTYFIMCSELPHYCTKTNVMIGIAPSGRHLHTKSLVFRLLCEFCEKNEKALHEAGIYEFFPKNGFIQKFLDFFCRRSGLTLQLCELLKDLIDSHHPDSFTKESILGLFSNFPSGTSVHNLARYGQSLRSRAIYKFDYGPEKNWLVYGSSKPPMYKLNAVTVPTVVIYGRNDGVVDIDDVKWLIRKLPNVIEAFEEEDTLWSHMDAVYSQYIPTLLYPKVMKHLNKI